MVISEVWEPVLDAHRVVLQYPMKQEVSECANALFHAVTFFSGWA